MKRTVLALIVLVLCIPVIAFAQQTGGLPALQADLETLQTNLQNQINALQNQINSIPAGPQGPAGPAGPQGPAGPTLQSINDLDGLLCTRGGSSGSIRLTFNVAGQAVLTCEITGGGSGKIGDACTSNVDCIGTDSSCIFGFCSRECGPWSLVPDCNSPLVANRNSGAYGNVYSCWPVGEGFNNICWPNGSGTSCSQNTDCPRLGESCVNSLCQYVQPEVPGLVRFKFICQWYSIPGGMDDPLYRTTCFPGEACMSQPDLSNLGIGACLWVVP